MHTTIADLGGVATVTADNSKNGRADLLGILQRAHQIWANVLLEISTAHRKHEDHILPP
jgi:hypothetical protein